MNVEDGGRVDTAAMIVGDHSGSEAAMVTIDGTGGASVMNIDAGFVVGNNRAGQLTVEGGGILNTGSTVGQNATSTWARLPMARLITIDGQGSKWNYTNTGRVRVGVAWGHSRRPVAVDNLRWR